MKVLWLSPVPLPAVVARDDGIANPGAGWIENLRASLDGREGLELGVACISREPFEPFTDGGVTYFPLWSPAESTKLKRALLAASWRDRSVDYSPQAAAVVREFQPDVIHIHGTELTLASVIGLTTVPAVLSLQGIVSEVAAHFFDGVTTGEVVRDFLRLPTTLRGHTLVPRYLSVKRSVPAEVRALSTGCFFTGRTRFDRAALRRLNADAPYFHCDRILRAQFYREPSAAPRDPQTIYCAGGRAPFKGVEVAIAATAELVRRGHTDVALRIGGPIIGTEMGPILARRARAAGIQDRVEWIGRMDADQIVAELSRCTVCIVPSHVDNSPNVLAEAMMLATPCVASDVGGIPSMVTDEETALLFAKGNAMLAADKLERMLTDGAFARRLGGAARDVAVVRHDPARIADVTMAMYREILAVDTADAGGEA